MVLYDSVRSDPFRSLFVNPPTSSESESESESELLLVTRPNDNHSPGSVMREVSP